MLMLEDGFKLFGGGTLERVLERATGSTPRAMSFGIVSTTLLQSSSLVSVITISFLSAGLISLIGGVGIIFGANIGTTTGAWLVAGLGLKVEYRGLRNADDRAQHHPGVSEVEACCAASAMRLPVSAFCSSAFIT